MSKLEIRGLTKRFGSNTVVDQVSLTVENGEFFVLLGPSGGGKTTILRMICGLEKPDAGQVLLDGRDITQLSPRQRNVGMVFQDYGLYPTMDVYGNIAYGLENRHMPKAEIQKRVEEAAAKLKLTPLLRRTITALSGGEQQRVALARILARDADLFLYDEPLANLDPKLRYQARRDIMAVHRARQVPSVYVTHDQTEAFAIGDRIAVIAHGKLQQLGTPDELLEAPANLFVARFIGSPAMNLLPVEVILDNSNYAIRLQDSILPLNEKWRQSVEQLKTSELILGIQPQAIIPAWQIANTDGDLSVITAEVTSIETLIGEIIVYLSLGPDQHLVAIWPDPETFPVAGDKLQIGVDLSTLCLFNPTTEQALQAERS
jgi:multiple sugar transport system ATP-binding protein